MLYYVYKSQNIKIYSGYGADWGLVYINNKFNDRKEEHKFVESYIFAAQYKLYDVLSLGLEYKVLLFDDNENIIGKKIFCLN